MKFINIFEIFEGIVGKNRLEISRNFMQFLVSVTGIKYLIPQLRRL